MYTAIWIVAWLLNGTPVTFSALVEGRHCSEETARNLYDGYIDAHNRSAFQADTYEFWCDLIERRPAQGA